MAWLFLPAVAGLFLYFWAFIASDNPLLAAVAHLVAVPLAYWSSRRIQIGMPPDARKLLRAAIFIGVVFWIPPVVVVLAAIVVDVVS